MEINDALVDKLSMLARLEFNDIEKAGIKSDLEKMIGLVDTLNNLDTSGVEPLMHICNNENVFREDVLTENWKRADALKNASLKDDQFFKVPKVIKK